MQFATPKQTSFIQSLIAERDLADAEKSEIADRLEGLSKAEASRTIEVLLARPAKLKADSGEAGNGLNNGASGSGVEVAEPGVFETDEGIFVVKRTQDGERLYAKRLVESPDRIQDETGEHVQFDFEYERGAIARLSEDDRMPLERAKKLAIRYGRCINCGRRLKAAESVEQGIGPVCIKRFKLG